MIKSIKIASDQPAIESTDAYDVCASPVHVNRKTRKVSQAKKNMKKRVDQIKAEKGILEEANANRYVEKMKRPPQPIEYLSPMKNRSERISKIIDSRISTASNNVQDYLQVQDPRFLNDNNSSQMKKYAKAEMEVA